MDGQAKKKIKGGFISKLGNIYYLPNYYKRFSFQITQFHVRKEIIENIHYVL